MLALGSGACNRLTGPSPIDANWRVHSTAHFSLHVRPGSFADQNAALLSDTLEDQYAFALARLEAAYEGRIAGFLYDTAADGGFSSAGEGVAFPLLTDAFKTVAAPPLDDNLLSRMSHEANHVIARHAIGQPGTSCMNEGLASALLSERYHRAGASFMHRWSGARLPAIPPISQICDDAKWDTYDQQLRYNASASFIAHLIDTDGAARLKQIYRVTSDDFATRFASIYGRSVDEAEAEWRRYAAGASAAAGGGTP